MATIFTVNEANLMLPEMLVALGFQSAGFSAAVALSDLLNFPQGFDVWDQDPETYSGHVVAALPRSAPLRRAMERRLTWELIFHSPREPLGVDEHLARLYAGEVSYMDHHGGRLLKELKRRGLYEDALIIITSDHGETFWEHGDVWNHGLAV